MAHVTKEKKLSGVRSKNWNVAKHGLFEKIQTRDYWIGKNSDYSSIRLISQICGWTIISLWLNQKVFEPNCFN